MDKLFDSNGHALKSIELRVYYFDDLTQEYTGWSDEFINIGVSLPGGCTDLKPDLAPKGMVSIYMDGSWEIREDHRGEVVYAITTGHPMTVDYIGNLTAEVTSIKPGSIFDKWDGSSWVFDEDAKKTSDIAINTAKKTQLLAMASVVIEPLKDALDGGYIDDADKPILTAWQKYRYELTKVDPTNATWPSQPTA